jgi:hypothetical protein
MGSYLFKYKTYFINADCQTLTACRNCFQMYIRLCNSKGCSYDQLRVVCDIICRFTITLSGAFAPFPSGFIAIFVVYLYQEGS